jgi:hypothetical protein
MVGGLQTVGERTFAGTRGNGEVAPIPDLPALTPERGGSTETVEITRLQRTAGRPQ